MGDFVGEGVTEYSRLIGVTDEELDELLRGLVSATDGLARVSHADAYLEVIKVAIFHQIFDDTKSGGDLLVRKLAAVAELVDEALGDLLVPSTGRLRIGVALLGLSTRFDTSIKLSRLAVDLIPGRVGFRGDVSRGLGYFFGASAGAVDGFPDDGFVPLTIIKD